MENGIKRIGEVGMTKPMYTEDDIMDIADQLDECDLGLLIAVWMNSHEAEIVETKCVNPDGTTDCFELKRIKMKGASVQ